MMQDFRKGLLTRREFVGTAGRVALAGSGLSIAQYGVSSEAQQEAVSDLAQQSEGKGLPMSSSRAKQRPNILIVYVDQHRADCLGAYGNPEVRTSHIDTLAADGVRFENSFCPFPVCTPSRYSFLSGLCVHEHRGCTNHCTLPPGTETFPALLKEAGYKTAAVGKMHFTPTYLDVGFERMVLAEQDGPGRWDDDYHRELRSYGLVDVNDLEDQRSEYREKARPEYWKTFGALPTNLPREWHSTEWIADRALEFLEGWGPEGNLLMVGFIKPHHPFDPPQELCEAYDPDKTALLPGWIPQCLPHDLELHQGYFPHEALTEQALRRVTAYYYATIHHIDLQVGRMVEVLKRKGLYEHTLVVYTADHGEYMGFHHMLLKGNHMYDPLVRVPLIVKYPLGQQKGAVSQALVSSVDLAPTILKQAGRRSGKDMHGIDIARDLEGRRVVFAESGRGGELMARTRKWKLLVCRDKDRTFFYDLEKDPLEMTNLYSNSAYEQDIAVLAEALDEWGGSIQASKPYLDEDAPVIPQPNVPARDDDHRETMIAYCQDMMQKERAARGNTLLR